jgi:hypothetical protein
MKLSIGLAAALLVAAPGVPAAAVIMQASLSGTVTSGTDLTGVFGSAGADLSGMTYSATYVFDTTRGALFAEPGFEQVYGGSVYGLATPIVASSITINGTTFDVGGGWQAHIKANTFNGRKFLNYYSGDLEDTPATSRLAIITQDWSTAATRLYPPESITTPFSYTMSAIRDNTGGSFYYAVYDIASEAYLAKTDLQLKPFAIVVGPAGVLPPPPPPPPPRPPPPPPPPPGPGVPEPSNWAMLIAGFGMIGGVARRSRKQVAGGNCAGS